MNEAEEIVKLMVERNFGWAISLYSPTSEAGEYFAGKLASLRDFLALQSLSESAPTLDILKTLVQSNPFKLDAFLEAMVSLKSVAILAASWRMIQGMQLKALHLDFQYAKSFSMTVKLESPYGESEEYVTCDIDDMNFLRHLMKSKSGDRPLINGFFALRRPSPKSAPKTQG